MAVGASHYFTVIIFAQECCRCEPSWGKNTKTVLRRLQRYSSDPNKSEQKKNQLVICIQDLVDYEKAHGFGSPDLSTVFKIPHVNFNTLPEMENKKITTFSVTMLANVTTFEH